ncbi:MAG: hypothetical protein FWD31_02540 [Planctomycetaceae bacterium]|nr:hypothetical protein [Planctomycetaceae bacterium]
MFDDLSRQLANEVVAVFRHGNPLYWFDGTRYRRFEAIKEPFDSNDYDAAGRRVKTKNVGFQVTGEVWRMIDAGTKDNAKRCLYEQDGETLKIFMIDRNNPIDEITGDRHAIRINTSFSEEKPIDDDFTGRIVPETP